MPYGTRPAGPNRVQVFNKETGAILAQSITPERAKEQIRAIHANERKRPRTTKEAHGKEPLTARHKKPKHRKARR